MRPPFIIIGMHRSGTSILTKVLEKSGIFMGVLKDPNYEAMHFLSINQQVLWKAGYNWYKPGVPAPAEWHDIPAEEIYIEHFKLNGRWAKWKHGLKKHDWGWKDPRNSFTLDMWLHKFPEAKVIHLVRNREAAAQSLFKRNKVAGEAYAEELKDLDYCRRLCEDYVNQARSYGPKLGANYLEIEYEALCGLEASSIQSLEAFCGKAIEQNLKTYLR